MIWWHCALAVMSRPPAPTPPAARAAARARRPAHSGLPSPCPCSLESLAPHLRSVEDLSIRGVV